MWKCSECNKETNKLFTFGNNTKKYCEKCWEKANNGM